MNDQTNKYAFTGVLSGWDDLIKEHYKLEHPIKRVTAGRNAFEIQPDLPKLFELLYEKIEENLNPDLKPSIANSNWDLRKAKEISENNESLEKQLEKRVVNTSTLSGWYNQVPAASGYASPTENRKNSIDLVYEIEHEKRYSFIELKVIQDSGSPFYACYENLSYGFLYLITRANQSVREIFSQSDTDKPLLRAKEIQLIVLAPNSYFEEKKLVKSDLKKFEEAVDSALRVFADSKVYGLKMGFEFRQFSNLLSLEDVAKFQGFEPAPYGGIISDS